NRVQLSEARRILNDRLLTEAMLAGVTVIDPATRRLTSNLGVRRVRVVMPSYRLAGLPEDER
ncbi:bifunctional UDP-N-acetylglucosamine diphosphorylase/glucosamine-1-phosphate N-acetyltransferase GlmU, partial [Streptomyces prunicolor]